MADIDSLINHIKTASDVDPWAKEMAEELLTKRKPVVPISINGSGYCPNCKTYVRWFDHFCSGCGAELTR